MKKKGIFNTLIFISWLWLFRALIGGVIQGTVSFWTKEIWSRWKSKN